MAAAMMMRSGLIRVSLRLIAVPFTVDVAGTIDARGAGKLICMNGRRCGQRRYEHTKDEDTPTKHGEGP